MRSQKIVFCDDGSRFEVKEYSNVSINYQTSSFILTNHSRQPKFRRPNDRVYIATPPLREGLFVVSSVVSRRYTLCDRKNRPVKNGKEFEESELELESEDLF